MNTEQITPVYNRAKTWQIGLFALNNTATNAPLVLMGFFAFFGQNVLGLGAAVLGIIATSMRLFDGITDPIIGYFIDKTDGKFGKFRPFMIIGNVIINTMLVVIFFAPQSLKGSICGYIYLTVFYIIYIIGYTFQTACTKGAQAALTNDPKQRPMFSIFDGIYNIILFVGATMLITTFMAPKYPMNMIDPLLWRHASLIMGGLSICLTILAVIGIAEKDRTEFFGLGRNTVKIKFKDYLEVIKNNRAIQMLVIAASTDKLALTAARGMGIYFYSNILLNVGLNGKVQGISAPIGVVAMIVGVSFARKLGMKKAFVASSWAAFLIGAALFILSLFVSPVSMPILFIAALVLQGAFAGIAGNIVIPMIADCSDYETSRSGRFIPGMMGTLFSFVDKLISSFAATLIGFGIAFAGYGNTIIEPNTAVNAKFQTTILFVMFLVPALGNLASVIAMKYYVLTGEKMKEIQQAIADKKTA